MGIPKFFRWISERYPMCSQLITDNSIPEFDNLYLDMNGIIHNCSHNNINNAHFRIAEEQIWISIFNYIDHLFSKIKPKKLFFLAIDGVAPRAKMNQQRSRRFRTARDAEELRQNAIDKGEELPEEEAFDSNCITPGTEFMKKLTEELCYFISKKIAEDVNWRNVEIVLSGPEVPGEGEHKIMEYIRLAKAQPDYDPNIRHCLYGLDADLIMLGLLSHDPHFALLREEVTFGRNNQKKKSLDNQKFYLMHLSLMREYLDLEFQSISKSLSFPYDFERVLDDFILLALFIGNDFLPNLPGLHIHEGALGLMFKIYKEVLPTCQGYLHDGGKVNLDRLQKILNGIAIVEKEAYEMESLDSLYLGGKKENGQTERGLLDALEKKRQQNKDQLVITDKQELIFRQVNNCLSKNKAANGATLCLDMAFKARDKKFIEKLARDLNMLCRINYDSKNKTTWVELSLDSNSKDEDGAAIRHCVLKKYQQAIIIPDNVSKEDVKTEEIEKFEVGLREWKANYYREKMDIDYNNKAQVDDIIKSYIVGIQWVLKYYYDGVASWGWFYPYHYAPRITDLQDIKRFENHEFSMGTPFKPFEQLMGVLPSLSKRLLPVTYQDLMTNSTSPIIDFYPQYFDLDMNEKKQDWEAIVKIPFIEQDRLLEAMRNREQRLTKEEIDRNQFGNSYKFSFDKELVKSDTKKIPVYPSPLPGVFPDIHHCVARKEVYHLPTLQNNSLKFRKVLLEGAKVGKNALAGFPSLQTIPFTHEIKHHGVNVFQQESSNESIVISLLNKYENINIEETAKMFLYKSIYIQYPYLKEAIVIGVSNAEKKYYVNFSHGKRQILEHFWDEKESHVWKQRIERAEYMPNKRIALDIGPTEIGFHVCTLKGMFQTEDGALVKEFINPNLEDLVPIQTVVSKVNNPDPRYLEKPAPPVEENFPIKSTVFFLGNKFLGAQASVVGHTNGSIDIELTVPAQEEHQIEPEFGHQIAQLQETQMKYKATRFITQALNLPPLVFSKITSALVVMDTNGQRVNIGLSLKFESKGEKVLGYTRKNPAGNWEFSSAAVVLIKEYCEQFPSFIEFFSNQNPVGMLNCQEFTWTTDGSKTLRQMKEWLKNKRVDSLPRVPLNTEELADSFCHQVEQAAIQYYNQYKDLELKKVVIRGVPRNVLLRPDDAPVRLNYQSFALGDRVVYVSTSSSVPLGNKGTVVGIQSEVVDVLFDSSFMCGTTLDGKCSRYCGVTLPYYSLINITNSTQPNISNHNQNSRNNNNYSNRERECEYYKGQDHDYNDNRNRENYHHRDRHNNSHQGNYKNGRSSNRSNGYRGGRGRGRGGSGGFTKD